MNTQQIVEKITNEAKTKNTKEIRTLKKFIIGKIACRQGDIYIHMVDKDFPVGGEIDCVQVVDGNSVGSRHILTGDFKVYHGVKLPGYINKQFFTVGKAFDVFGQAVLTHPEHAHCKLITGRYVISHQIDIRTMKRVSD